MKKCIIARSFVCPDGYEWFYDCGWRIISRTNPDCFTHPYRKVLDGDIILQQPIGVAEIARDLGVIPARCK